MTHWTFNPAGLKTGRGLVRALRVVGLASGVALAGVATAQSSQILVKWEDPEIKRFQAQTRTCGLGAGLEGECSIV